MTLSRDEILGQVSAAIDAAEESATAIEQEAREKAEAIVADARAEAKRVLERAQSAVAGLAAEITGEVPEPPAPVPDPVPEPDPSADPPLDPVPEPTPLPEPPSEEPAPAATTNGNDAGARLVAMKMALEGTSREEVAAHLADVYGLDDSDALLDDVFTRAGSS